MAPLDYFYVDQILNKRVYFSRYLDMDLYHKVLEGSFPRLNVQMTHEEVTHWLGNFHAIHPSWTVNQPTPAATTFNSIIHLEAQMNDRRRFLFFREYDSEVYRKTIENYSKIVTTVDHIIFLRCV